jgi:hypothetical protein
MNNCKTYWIISLSLLLSFSMVLPVCCEADISELFSHQQKTAAHATHGQHSDEDNESCACGHERVKDFQKTKKVVAGPNVSSSSAGLFSEASPISYSNKGLLSFLPMQRGVLTDTGPPLHLLNSVFLN